MNPQEVKVIEFDEKCKSCRGTGLYQGMAEKDGFAVVCSTCKGTGCHHFVYKYEEFSERIDNPRVLRVLETNPGIVVGTNNGQFPLDHFGGTPYEDWKLGKPFPPKSEMRKFTCPSWWCQSADYKKKPRWDECWMNLGSSFSHCNCFPTKEKCWERFDKENEL